MTHAWTVRAALPPPPRQETEAAINENRNKYRTVAARGSMLFFLLNSLNKIHAFYQFSLNAFVGVFGRGLDLAPGGRRKKGPGAIRKAPSLKDPVSHPRAHAFTYITTMNLCVCVCVRAAGWGVGASEDRA